MLFDARRRERGRELLDIGRDDHRLDLVESEASALAPPGEASDGREVREAGVPVPDVGGEELPEAPLGVLGGREERWRRRVVAREGREARDARAGTRSGNMGAECTSIRVVHKGRYVTFMERLVEARSMGAEVGLSRPPIACEPQGHHSPALPTASAIVFVFHGRSASPLVPRCEGEPENVEASAARVRLAGVRRLDRAVGLAL